VSQYTAACCQVPTAVFLCFTVNASAMLRTLTQPKAALPHPSPLPEVEGEDPKGEEPQAGGTDLALAFFSDV
jgi:hypothetical protein